MKAKTEVPARQQAEGRAREQEKSEAANTGHVPGKLTFAQNVIGTVKVLAIAGLVIATLWGLDVWIAGR